MEIYNEEIKKKTNFLKEMKMQIKHNKTCGIQIKQYEEGN